MSTLIDFVCAVRCIVFRREHCKIQSSAATMHVSIERRNRNTCYKTKTWNRGTEQRMNKKKEYFFWTLRIISCMWADQMRWLSSTCSRHRCAVSHRALIFDAHNMHKQKFFFNSNWIYSLTEFNTFWTAEKGEIWSRDWYLSVARALFIATLLTLSAMRRKNFGRFQSHACIFLAVCILIQYFSHLNFFSVLHAINALRLCLSFSQRCISHLVSANSCVCTDIPWLRIWLTFLPRNEVSIGLKLMVMAKLGLDSQHDRHRDVRRAQCRPMLYSVATTHLLTKMYRICLAECPFLPMCLHS